MCVYRLIGRTPSPAATRRIDTASSPSASAICIAVSTIAARVRDPSETSSSQTSSGARLGMIGPDVGRASRIGPNLHRHGEQSEAAVAPLALVPDDAWHVLPLVDASPI